MSARKSSRQVVPLPGQEYANPVPPIHKLSLDLYGKQKLAFTPEELAFSPEELEALSKPSVLIAGGGIGGLTLALLLHNANIPFLVLERAKEIKPLGECVIEIAISLKCMQLIGTRKFPIVAGSSILLGATVAPLFVQLGIYDEFLRCAKRFTEMNLLKDDLTHVHTLHNSYLHKAPELYDLLFKRIPKNRIIIGKRVVSFQQNQDSVMVRCSDDSSYHGDILVGADGAYSAVRQHLYRSLKEDKKLPASDDVSLPFSCVCLVGQTVPLDPEEFPLLKEKLSQCDAVLSDSTMCTVRFYNAFCGR
ncbi:hypothetical protein BG006_008111 [Podila minutissima]|uniref:FAD-binding domain-containing protein n=1 Tax=Podila minutissima TaxID=64525 RepID=A0A9P5SGK9_9FUNG|nr:hypothetical protein BG006_008111 [Podila minutissima]